MDRLRIDKEIEKEKNSAPEGCTPSETREGDGRGGRRGDSRWVSLLTDGVSVSEPFLISHQYFLTVRQPTMPLCDHIPPTTRV